MTLIVSSCRVPYYYTSGDTAPKSEEIALFDPVIQLNYFDDESVSEVPESPLYEVIYDSLLKLTEESFIVYKVIPADNDRLLRIEAASLKNLDKDILFALPIPELLREKIQESGNRYGVVVCADCDVEKSREAFSFKTKQFLVVLDFNLDLIVLDALSNTVTFYAQDSDQLAPFSYKMLRKLLRRSMKRMLKQYN
ncbi:MAG: hypothetical protein J5699_00525 [Bacteroidales bacterium]|nr:hypothetical protein [Bacteroidales bacterium]